MLLAEIPGKDLYFAELPLLLANFMRATVQATEEGLGYAIEREGVYSGGHHDHRAENCPPPRGR
jgi:hypothetical protein